MMADLQREFEQICGFDPDPRGIDDDYNEEPPLFTDEDYAIGCYMTVVDFDRLDQQ